MILYHAISSFQLIVVVLLKIAFHSTEKGILIISLDVVNRLKGYKNFLNFFDDILEYDNGYGNRVIASGNNPASYFDDILKSKRYQISNFNKIYLACAHHSFGIYVAQKNIPYVFVEDGVGALSRPEVLHKVEEKAPIKDCLSVEYGLYDGSNENAIACIYNRNYQVDGFEHSDRYIHFDVYTELSKLNDNTRKDLLRIFTKMNDIPCGEHSVLLLTEHFANLRIFSWEEQILLYQLLIDYFFDDYSLVLKPHPDDLMYYEELFPDSYIIKDRFPSEILPFLFSKKPRIVATVSSTAIYTLKGCFENTIAFNYDFSHNKRQFKDLHRIYTALKIAEEISTDTIYLYAINQVIMDNFILMGKTRIKRAVHIKSLDEFALYPENSVLIIDNCPYYSSDNEISVCSFLEKLEKNKTVIFINSENDYCFYSHDKKNLCEYIYQVKIEKEINCNECYGPTEPEYVYCLSKNRIDFKSICFTLKYVGISVSAKQLKGAESSVQLLINILNAMNIRLARALRINNDNRKLLSKVDFERIPEFNVDYGLLEESYLRLNTLEGYDEKDFWIVKGMLFAVEKRYLYILEENKYLEELIAERRK